MARASATRWRWPPDSTLPSRADRRVVAVGQRQDRLVQADGPRGGLDLGRVDVGRSARCSRPACRRTARRPAAGSRCAGRAPACSRRTRRRRRAGPCRWRRATARPAGAPAWSCPDAVGPTTASTSPGAQGERDAAQDRRLAHPGPRDHVLHRQRPFGGGSGMPRRADGDRFEHLAQARVRGLARRPPCAIGVIVCCSGASARLDRIQATIIALPAIGRSPVRVSQQPSPGPANPA